jgi:hypothetical protein
MKFLVILVVLVANTVAQNDYLSYQQQTLQALGQENYEFGEKAKCIQKQFFHDRQEQISVC